MPDPVVIITHCPLSAIVFVYVESSSVCVGFCVLLRISQSPMSGCLAQNRRNPRVSPSTQGLCLERGAGSILEPRPDSKIFTLSFSFSFSFPFFLFFIFFPFSFSFFFFFFFFPHPLLPASPLTISTSSSSTMAVSAPSQSPLLSSFTNKRSSANSHFT